MKECIGIARLQYCIVEVYCCYNSRSSYN